MSFPGRSQQAKIHADKHIAILIICLRLSLVVVQNFFLGVLELVVVRSSGMTPLCFDASPLFCLVLLLSVLLGVQMETQRQLAWLKQPQYLQAMFEILQRCS